MLGISADDKLWFESFAATFTISLSLQEYFYGLWLLDTIPIETTDKQKMLHEASSILVDPSIQLEHAPRIMRILTDFGTSYQALKFVRSVKIEFDTMEQISTYMQILLSNGLIHEAFQFQARYLFIILLIYLLAISNTFACWCGYPKIRNTFLSIS